VSGEDVRAVGEPVTARRAAGLEKAISEAIDGSAPVRPLRVGELASKRTGTGEGSEDDSKGS